MSDSFRNCIVQQVVRYSAIASDLCRPAHPVDGRDDPPRPSPRSSTPPYPLQASNYYPPVHTDFPLPADSKHPDPDPAELAWDRTMDCLQQQLDSLESRLTSYIYSEGRGTRATSALSSVSGVASAVEAEKRGLQATEERLTSNIASLKERLTCQLQTNQMLCREMGRSNDTTIRKAATDLHSMAGGYCRDYSSELHKHALRLGEVEALLPDNIDDHPAIKSLHSTLRELAAEVEESRQRREKAESEFVSLYGKVKDKLMDQLHAERSARVRMESELLRRIKDAPRLRLQALLSSSGKPDRPPSASPHSALSNSTPRTPRKRVSRQPDGDRVVSRAPRSPRGSPHGRDPPSHSSHGRDPPSHSSHGRDPPSHSSHGRDPPSYPNLGPRVSPTRSPRQVHDTSLLCPPSPICQLGRVAALSRSSSSPRPSNLPSPDPDPGPHVQQPATAPSPPPDTPSLRPPPSTLFSHLFGPRGVQAQQIEPPPSPHRGREKDEAQSPGDARIRRRSPRRPLAPLNANTNSAPSSHAAQVNLSKAKHSHSASRKLPVDGTGEAAAKARPRWR